MKWASVKIEAIRDASRHSLVGGPFGSDLTTRDYVDEGVPVIRGVNLPDDRQFNDDGFVFVSAEKADALAANNAGPGDVVFTQRGTLGQVGLIPPDSRFPRYLISQSQMKLTVDAAKVNAKYVFYYFRHPTTVQNIKNHAITSGVPHINLGILRDFDIPLPPLPTQNRIVESLSAYDDLIENNRRRMALLEESAQLLYQEWFVRLRFPGHEHVRVVNGLPKEWERRTLGDCLTLKRGHDLPESARIPGTIPIVSSSGITGFHNAKKADGPGLVTGRYGTLGAVYYIDEDYWPHNTALYVCDFKGNSARVLYFFLKHALQDAQSNNAAVPGLNRNVLHTLRVLWPPENLRDHFDGFLEPLFHQLATLRRFNEKLTDARDLLLPRLMSGEITA